MSHNDVIIRTLPPLHSQGIHHLYSPNTTSMANKHVPSNHPARSELEKVTNFHFQQKASPYRRTSDRKCCLFSSSSSGSNWIYFQFPAADASWKIFINFPENWECFKKKKRRKVHEQKCSTYSFDICRT